jgi:simple sugar transport system permease protein
MPFSSGGDLFGWRTPDPLGWFERKQWFLISDVAGMIRGLTRVLSLDIVLAALFIVLAWYLLWRTPVGLRLRASGEKPSAPDSLGVSVAKMRYLGMAMSGAMAGFGGTILVLFANRYQQDQTGGRGFLGLATLIFGNWRPSGLAAGAGLFGYASGITLRAGAPPPALVRALFLAAGLALAVAVVWCLATRKIGPLIVAAALGALAFWAYVVFKRPDNNVVYVFPYVVTLCVVAARSQSLRPPAAEGIPYFKGQQG